ncbi:hypothetical protein Ddc_10470 [Ditylenchus destructor]|nr:hypothetical protein Ddc_10470 [Ditylenchus destructor]
MSLSSIAVRCNWLPALSVCTFMCVAQVSALYSAMCTIGFLFPIRSAKTASLLLKALYKRQFVCHGWRCLAQSANNNPAGGKIGSIQPAAAAIHIGGLRPRVSTASARAKSSLTLTHSFICIRNSSKMGERCQFSWNSFARPQTRCCIVALCRRQLYSF